MWYIFWVCFQDDNLNRSFGDQGFLLEILRLEVDVVIIQKIMKLEKEFKIRVLNFIVEIQQVRILEGIVGKVVLFRV